MILGNDGVLFCFWSGIYHVSTEWDLCPVVGALFKERTGHVVVLKGVHHGLG